MAHDHHHDKHSEPQEPHEKSLERMNRFQEREARAAIRDLRLPAGSRGIDVGCGVGLWARWLAEAVGPDGKVVGIEPTAERVEAARALTGDTLSDGRSALSAGQVEFREGDALAIDAPDGAFDWLWCGDVLHHIPETLSALKEFIRVVRPGGLVIIKESQTAPAVFLPGHPELEGRIRAAEIAAQRDEAGAQSFQERRQRTPGSMREAGLSDVTMSTYLIQRHAPLDAASRDYIERTVFGRNWGERLHKFLSADDWQRRSRLCEPDSKEFVLTSPDYYCLYSFTVFTARPSA